MYTQIGEKIVQVCGVRCDSIDRIPFFVLQVANEGLNDLFGISRHKILQGLYLINKRRIAAKLYNLLLSLNMINLIGYFSILPLARFCLYTALSTSPLRLTEGLMKA